MKFLILNGPNMNLLGIREPEIYGRGTYEELVAQVSAHAGARGVEVEFFQSNHEGALVDAIQNAYFSGADGIVFNPAAYTHTSIAIADAVRAVGIPTVEVHISDVDTREPYRRVSYLSGVAIHTVKGRGFAGYTEALDVLIDRAGQTEKQKSPHTVCKTDTLTESPAGEMPCAAGEAALSADCGCHKPACEQGSSGGGNG